MPLASTKDGPRVKAKTRGDCSKTTRTRTRSAVQRGVQYNEEWTTVGADLKLAALQEGCPQLPLHLLKALLPLLRLRPQFPDLLLLLSPHYSTIRGQSHDAGSRARVTSKRNRQSEPARHVPKGPWGRSPCPRRDYFPRTVRETERGGGELAFFGQGNKPAS